MLNNTDHLPFSTDIAKSLSSTAESTETLDDASAQEGADLFLAEIEATHVEEIPSNPSAVKSARAFGPELDVLDTPPAPKDFSSIERRTFNPLIDDNRISEIVHNVAAIDADFVAPEADQAPTQSIDTRTAEIEISESAPSQAIRSQNRTLEDAIPETEIEIEGSGKITSLGAAISLLNKDMPPSTNGRERSAAIKELITAHKSERALPKENTAPTVAQIKYSAPDVLTPEITEGVKRDLPMGTPELPTSNSKTPIMLTQPEFQAAPIIDTKPPTTQLVQQAFNLTAQNTTPMQKVAQALAMVTHNQDRLVVRLDPPELGRVTVEFQFDAQRAVTAVISAENADIGNQLREKSEFFFKSLKLAGFEDVSLNFETDSNASKNEGRFSEEHNGREMGFYASELEAVDSDLTAITAPSYNLNSNEKLNLYL